MKFSRYVVYGALHEGLGLFGYLFLVQPRRYIVVVVDQVVGYVTQYGMQVFKLDVSRHLILSSGHDSGFQGSAKILCDHIKFVVRDDFFAVATKQNSLITMSYPI
jgi:hypothetical protein